MNTKEPIVIHGQTIGRFKASWLLFKETFRFLRADPEVVAVPLIVGLCHLFLFGVVLFGYIALMFQGVIPDSEELGPVDYGFIFVLYILSAFAVAITNATIAFIVAVRATGGDATLGQGFGAAFKKASPLLVWSAIAATVGLILRVVSERSQLLGKIVAMVAGAAWAILTYFVIQAIMLEGHSAPKGIARSGQVFRSVWGEMLVTNFSFGLVFFLVYVIVIIGWLGLFVALLSTPVAAIVMTVLLFVVIFAVSLLHSAMSSVLKTLLFIYATNGGAVQGFDPELLDRMLKKNNNNNSNNTNPAPTATPMPIIDAPPRDQA